jgi:D-3-phosphoglycerate dehydrogenase
MRALITASFEPACLRRLERHMSVVHEDWKRDRKIYFDGAELAARIRAVEADVLIVEADLVHAEVFSSCRLAIVGCCRGDPINIDRETATRLGVPIFFTPGRNADAVADLAVAFMLGLARHVFAVNHELKAGTLRFERTEDYLAMYERYTGRELGGATVGVVGLGYVGRAVARRLHGFGSRILGYDPYAGAIDGVTTVDLPTLVRESDFLSVHCAATEATRGLIGAAELATMKPGAYVLNLARASVVDEDALYEALVSGRLAGAALDVFGQEPVQPDNRFVGLPNVLVMPHLGGATVDVVRHQSEMIVECIEAYLAGRQPPYVWNPEVLTVGGGSRTLP